ncbi:hypothetical protein [Novosphingobium lindaniclasticum]
MAWQYDLTVDHNPRRYWRNTQQRGNLHGWTETPLYARPASPTNPERLVDARTIAFAEAFYGPNFDPFNEPEKYNHLRNAMEAPLSAAPLKEGE